MKKKRFVDLGHLVPQESYPPLKLQTYEVDLLISMLKEQSPAMEAYRRVIEGIGTHEDEKKYQGSAEYRLFHHMTNNGNTLNRDTFILTAHMHLLLCRTEESDWYKEHSRELFVLGTKLHTWWLKHSTNRLDHITPSEENDSGSYVVNYEDHHRVSRNEEYDEDGVPLDDYDDLGWIHD